MGRLTFLGTGTSQGVPMIGCNCEVCKSENEKDKRLRASAYIEYQGLNILIDAGPDFRTQILREGISHIDAILLTHNHKDHTGGLDDVRAFNYIEKAPTKIYCEKYVENSLRMEYSYAFAEKRYPGVPEWQITNIDDTPFTVKENIPSKRLVWVDGKGYEKCPVSIRDWAIEHGVPEEQADSYIPKEIEIVPIRGKHYTLPVLGYRFGNIAYLTDMNSIADSELEKLKGLEHFIINCVRREKHISHFSLDEAVNLALKVDARHSWLTHLSHLLPTHEQFTKELVEKYGDRILPAYDGLVIED